MPFWLTNHFNDNAAAKELCVIKFFQCILHIIFGTKLDDSTKTQMKQKHNNENLQQCSNMAKIKRCSVVFSVPL